MSAKWHINDLGEVGICKAKLEPCPFDKNAGHFATKDDAYKWIKERELKKDNLLPKHKSKKDYKIASSRKDVEYIRKRRMELLQAEEDPYIKRCKSSKRLHEYQVSNEATSHYQKERIERDAEISKSFGEGELLGYYEVNHLVTSNKRSFYRKQIVEIRSNGQIVIYDHHTGSKITTFIAHSARIEGMMLLANNIPDKEFLEVARENRDAFKKLGL